MSVKLLHVFESLQMQCQNDWRLFHSHPLLRLLVAAAVVTLKFVFIAKPERNHVTDVSQTSVVAFNTYVSVLLKHFKQYVMLVF